MKKLLLGFMLILSIAVLADGDRFERQEKMLENSFEINRSTLTDGKIKLKDIDYDVEIYENYIMIKLEMETFFGDGNWSKFDKEIFESLVEELVAETRETMNDQTIDVDVTLEVDKIIGSDKSLYYKKF